MLQFDAETARLLEISYQGADVSRRRRASFDALQPKPGEQIVDIGCGNGLLTLELARAVGGEGRVVGLDPSEDMRKPAAERCAAFPCVETMHGTATDMPLEDGSMDGAVSVQVYEYLDDFPAAAKEACRVLRPGGRLIIGDNHWDTLTWYSEDRDRMDRMIEAWDRHLTERCVPAILPPVLAASGFVVEDLVPVPLSDSILKPDGLANMLIVLMERYARDNQLIDDQEAQDWAAEQRALAEAGRFFFSLTHFVISARKL
jgi:SAM-dependent methyltransferase